MTTEQNDKNEQIVEREDGRTVMLRFFHDVERELWDSDDKEKLEAGTRVGMFARNTKSDISSSRERLEMLRQRVDEELRRLDRGLPVEPQNIRSYAESAYDALRDLQTSERLAKQAGRLVCRAHGIEWPEKLGGYIWNV